MSDFRSKTIASPKFQILLDFRKHKSGSVVGKIDVTFDLKEKLKLSKTQLAKVIYLDFFGEVESLRFNHHALEVNRDFVLRKGKVVFKFSALKLLKTRKNLISISFRSQFSTPNKGHGLVGFFDEVDGQNYYYTKKPPFRASWLFPCFDQPNMPTVFDLEVIAPTQWTVVASTLCIGNKKVARYQRWSFEKSIPYPCYQFCFLAGPYDIWIGPPPADGRIPLTFYARKSIKKVAQWGDLGMCVRHPRDFEYFWRSKARKGN